MVADDHRVRTARLWAAATVRNGTVSEGDHPNGVSEESNAGITRKPTTSSPPQYRRAVCRIRPPVSGNEPRKRGRAGRMSMPEKFALRIRLGVSNSCPWSRAFRQVGADRSGGRTRTRRISRVLAQARPCALSDRARRWRTPARPQRARRRRRLLRVFFGALHDGLQEGLVVRGFAQAVQDEFRHGNRVQLLQALAQHPDFP